MRQVFFIFIILFLFSIYGFEARYYFHGKDIEAFYTQSPNHEKITKNGFNFVCNKYQSQNLSGKDFINENLYPFLDDIVNECSSEWFAVPLSSIYLGVKYNDAPEIDGFSGMNKDYYSEYKAALTAIKHACNVCAFFWANPLLGGFCPTDVISSAIYDVSGLTSAPGTSTTLSSLVSISACINYWSLFDEDDFKISKEVDCSNSTLYPIMHGQLNSRNFGKNPKKMIPVIKNYIESYFYELLMLAIEDDDAGEVNFFVTYNDLTQHTKNYVNLLDSNVDEDIIRSVDYKKILMGELFHTIEDSFAHNLRYLDSDGRGNVLKIGAVLNMKTKEELYGDFKHDSDFGPMDWNCAWVDNTANWDWDEEISISLPMDFDILSGNEHYFSSSWIDGYGEINFIKDEYASTMASHAIADFLYRLGEAVKKIKDPNFKGKYNDFLDPLIEEYLRRWFTDGTDIFDPIYSNDYFSEDYDSIISDSKWENFHNVDLWFESGIYDRTGLNIKAVFLPWIPESERCSLSTSDQANRWVFKTIENYPLHLDFVEGAINSYDSSKNIMTFTKSSFNVIWSWLDGNSVNSLDFADRGYLEQKFSNFEEQKIYELPDSTERSPAAIFIPRGFKVCLHYESDGIPEFDDNDAARFFKMPTYRCFYGGKSGRLITGGKEDALKPGTKIYAKPIDIDGDYFFDDKDNCPFDFNPKQEDFDGDGIGNPCDSDFDGDGIDNERDNCPYVYNPAQVDSDNDDVGDVCDACQYVKDENEGRPIAHYIPNIIFPTIESIPYGLIEEQLYQTVDGEWKMIDSDLDGVPDDCDNCKFVPNPRKVVSHYKEILLAPKDPDSDYPDEGGAAAMVQTRSSGKIYNRGYPFVNPTINWSTNALNYAKFENIPGPFYAWQADHDLDGIGDVCDYNGGENGMDTGNNPGTSVAKISNIVPERIIEQEDSGPIKFVENALYKLELFAAKWNEAGIDPFDVETKSTVHFCGMSKEDYVDNLYGSNWGRTGYCTFGEATVYADFYGCTPGQPNNECLPAHFESKKVAFGYSHGTDPAVATLAPEEQKPWTHIAWSNSLNDAKKINQENLGDHRIPIIAKKGSFFNRIPYVKALEDSGIGIKVSPFWNWREDAYNYLQCNIKEYDICNQLDVEAGNPDDAEKFFYTLSAGARGDGRDYIVDSLSGGKRINPHYFHNERMYARSDRYSINAFQAFAFAQGLESFEKYLKFPKLFKYSQQPDIDIDVKKVSHWIVTDTNYNFINKSVPENSLAITSGPFNTLYSIVSEDGGKKALYINYAEDAGDWHRLFMISNFPAELEIRGINLIGESLYIAGVDEGITGSPFRIYRFNMNPAVMNMSVIHEFDAPLYQVSFLEVNNTIFMSGISENALAVYSLNSYDVSEKIQLPVRQGYTLTTDGSSLYISGGKNENEVPFNDIIVSNDNGKTWEEFADLSNYQVDISTSFIHFSNGVMYIVNPEEEPEEGFRAMTSINISTGDIAVEEILIDSDAVDGDESEICFFEESNFLESGINIYGVCTPYTEKNFSSFSVGSTVKTLAGSVNLLAVGTGNDVKIYDISEPLNPQLLHTQSVYGPASDMLIYNNKLIVAVENGIDSIDLETLTYTHIATYGTTKAIEMYDGKLYVGDGQGIKVLNPDDLTILQQVNTSGDVSQLAIIDDVIYTIEWAGLKRYDTTTLSSITTDSYYLQDEEMLAYDGKLYVSKNGYIEKLTFSGSAVIEADLMGDEIDLRNSYTTDFYTYFPSGSSLRISTVQEIPEPVCGNGVVEDGEICDGNSVACTSLSGDYIDGIATCNSTCSGYDESSCEEDDGW